MNFPMNGVGPEDLETSSRCYLAMLDLMREENLDALALQCWPDIPNLLGQWPYLAISRLSSEGYAVSIEGDVDGCLGSLMNLQLGFGPSFLTDWLEHDHSTVHFWHPGMAPLAMCHPIGEDGGPTLANHFNLARPCVVDARLRTDEPVTITRLWSCDNRYHLTAFEGRTIPPRRRITGSTVLVETTEADIPKRFDTLVHAGMPHHVLLSFGHHAETFRRLARMLRLEWCT
jgi:L-fucose isomerase-like protein